MEPLSLLVARLNSTGTLIWEQLDGRTSGHDVVRAMGQRPGVEPERAAADYREFVETLLALGAIARAPDSTPG